MSNFFILSFDPHKTNSDSLHQVVKTSPLIDDWSHYLASSYIIKSSYTANDLTNHLLDKWPNARFLIVKIDNTKRNGWLPRKAWDWFRKYDK